MHFRTCQFELEPKIKTFLKQKFNISDDIRLHLHYQVFEGKNGRASCERKGQNFSLVVGSGVVNSTKAGVKQHFEFISRGDSIMLQNLITGDLIEDSDFCIDYDGTATACTTSCLGRKPCLRYISIYYSKEPSIYYFSTHCKCFVSSFYRRLPANQIHKQN